MSYPLTLASILTNTSPPSAFVFHLYRPLQLFTRSLAHALSTRVHGTLPKSDGTGVEGSEMGRDDKANWHGQSQKEDEGKNQASLVSRAEAATARVTSPAPSLCRYSYLRRERAAPRMRLEVNHPVSYAVHATRDDLLGLTGTWRCQLRGTGMRRCGLKLLNAVPVDAPFCLLLNSAPKVEYRGTFNS